MREFFLASSTTLLVVMACGVTDPHVADCEERLPGRLKAPATLKIVRTDHEVQDESPWSFEKRIAAKERGEAVIEPPPRWEEGRSVDEAIVRDVMGPEVVYAHKVTITFDSENSYGALLRGQFVCEYSEEDDPPYLVPARTELIE